jgi:hypothetical protein
MDDAETPASRPASPTAEPRPAPTEAELSRIARDAVRQPADPRLDRQLAAMGLAGPVEAAQREPRPQAGRGLEVERFDRRVRRLEVATALLAAAVVILGAAVLVLLSR